MWLGQREHPVVYVHLDNGASTLLYLILLLFIICEAVAYYKRRKNGQV